MVLLLAIALGLAIGFATGGSLANAGAIRLRLLPLMVAALLVQVAIFTSIAGSWDITHRIGPWVYIGTLLVTLFVMVRNFHIPGMPIIAIGAALNALVITANGGFMPSPRSALERAGKLDTVQPEDTNILSNSTIADDDTRLSFLGDVIVIPERYPFANVMSIGDIVIAIGAIVAIVIVMHRKQSAPKGSPAADVTA